METGKGEKMKGAYKGFMFVTAILLLVLSLVGSPTMARKRLPAKVNGEHIFQNQCASCHVGGGNRVNPKAPLAGSAKLSTEALFQDYLRNPSGHMPYYKNLDVDKDALKSLFEYCKTLKQPVKETMRADFSS